MVSSCLGFPGLVHLSCFQGCSCRLLASSSQGGQLVGPLAGDGFQYLQQGLVGFVVGVFRVFDRPGQADSLAG